MTTETLGPGTSRASPAGHGRVAAGRTIERRAGRRILALAALAATVPLVAWAVAALVQPPDLYNDFHSYWYAGRLLEAGRSPYDLAALRALAAESGDAFVVGTGYSYLLPFALVMVPLSNLPFDLALFAFDTLSVAAFAIVVGWWLVRCHPTASWTRLRIAALLAGVFPPVVGSVLNGQANLLVGAILAVGVVLALDRSRRRAFVGGVMTGLAAVVKLVPSVLAAPFALAARSRVAAVGLAAGLVVPIGLSVLARPGDALGTMRLELLFGPDPFITNQSLNGFVSRLVLSSARMTALDPGAFDPVPVVVALTAALAGLTLWILWRARARLSEPDGLALSIALSLVAATAGAPKTSLWNTSLVLVSVGLLLAVSAPRLELGSLDRPERLAFVGWWTATALQPLVWIPGPQAAGPGAALVVVLGSLALYGTLGLYWLIARRLLRPASAAGTSGSPAGSPGG
jgi:hypothetical protein